VTRENEEAREQPAAYEPPVVEDLDAGYGPVETAPLVALPPSTPPIPAAPRDF
jgi:hypothetical protein